MKLTRHSGIHGNLTMRRRLLSILVFSILVASTLVGCSQPYALSIFSITGGNVSVLKAGANDWIEAKVGMSLEVGDSMKTGDDSSAEITFVDGSTIELQAGTQIKVASLATTGTGSATIVVQQAIGSIIFRVTKIIDPASRYEVETPAGVVAVRGSAVQVHVIEDGTTWATNLEGDIWAFAQGVELQIPEGRRCIIDPGRPPELEVTFADPNLEAAVRQAISKPEGPIYASDLDRLTNLVAAQSSISNLSGLEHCTSLEWLNLQSNQITDISPLANLTYLTSLGLADNQITDISPLANLADLTVLWLSANQISDLSPLGSLTSLEQLWLPSNPISDISPLGNLTRLISLSLTFNQISDISPLANLTHLTSLGLSGHQISDIALVVDLSRLIFLDLQDSQIGDISHLASLTALERLWLNNNQISDISPLANLTNLTDLSLNGNQISDISPLTNLTKLRHLLLYNNQISDISPLANLTNLIVLGLEANQIRDIAALVQNDGLATGDIVDLRSNPLSSDSINIYIPQLEARGVAVTY